MYLSYSISILIFWAIEKGDGRGSGISVLMAQHDDDDDVLCFIVF